MWVKAGTNEKQGISFKVGEYKFKGSEIDRNFSIRNLQNAINQQQLKSLLHPPVDTSKLLSQNKKFEITKEESESKNIIDLLIKPEHSNQLLPYQWRLDKNHKKKRSSGLNL